MNDRAYWLANSNNENKNNNHPDKQQPWGLSNETAGLDVCPTAGWVRELDSNNDHPISGFEGVLSLPIYQQKPIPSSTRNGW
jgi:hypothetical protein